MKQVILVREDLKLPKGKLAVQVAHASVEAVLNSSKVKVAAWRGSQKKVVLKVKDKKELFFFQKLAKDLGLVASVITDAGKTVVAPGTVTCLGIGPDKDSLIDSLTGKLKMV